MGFFNSKKEVTEKGLRGKRNFDDISCISSSAAPAKMLSLRLR